jgi:protein-S-isoprenylcysteine O-methyltransferase Ste14
MSQYPPVLFPATWLAWALYWRAESRAAKGNVWAESITSRLMHVVPTAVAALLLVLHVPVWARRHLATNWSADVTLKENHELITSGPYGWARHQIYTGLLLGFIGTALAVGRWRGVAAVGLMGLALWRKLRIEERGMRQLFGEQYTLYAKRVSALIPFLL